MDSRVEHFKCIPIPKRGQEKNLWPDFNNFKKKLRQEYEGEVGCRVRVQRVKLP